jgi:hypothetical protein
MSAFASWAKIDSASQEFVPFDAVLVGTMDRDMYTPLATRGFPLSCLPRRETFCSHTINQPGGSVLMLPNMPADPRFAQAPHVAQGGLISYSGTPLRYSFSRDDGVREEVMLGTLCGVSFSDPMSPNALQQRAMVHCADTIVREIVEHARNTRAGTRDKMASRLSSLADRANEGNAVNLVLAALQETYPKADVSFQNHDDSNITLIGVGPVPYADFEHHLYEDSAYIEAEILSDNHLPTSTVRNRTLRAVAVKCTSAADTYLVVQSAELPHIFDDVDAAVRLPPSPLFRFVSSVRYSSCTHARLSSVACAKLPSWSVPRLPASTSCAGSATSCAPPSTHS